MHSLCCSAPIHVSLTGEWICMGCGAVIYTRQSRPATRDLMAWLFPPEPGAPPRGEPVFVRVGKRIRKVDRIRGKPDGWCWIDA
jgi:hypothetical protein